MSERHATQQPHVVVATHNAHKVAELESILREAIPALRLGSYDGPEPVEDGTSFAQNALIKARAAAAHTGLPSLADDSGLCVRVMGGAPGIFSARWTPNRDPSANNELLLWQLADVSDAHRDAYFVCAAALALPDGTQTVTEGRWFGHILRKPDGEGFGYDPIFRPEGSLVSAARLEPAQKNAHSHRGRAFRDLVPHLQGCVATASSPGRVRLTG